jgi:FkbM family methyltransferase
VTVKHELRRLVWKLGYDVTPFNATWSGVARRRHLLCSLGIDVVLDVGANVGQYARQLRRDVGFEGRICSFEPMRGAFRVLEVEAADDPKWSTFNLAIGDVAGSATINIAANSESSSLLPMLASHSEAAPESRFVGTEQIETQTLDALFDNLCATGEHVYLKIDTQGFEGRVLAGADRSLPRIDTLQIEMALTPLYEGEIAFADLLELLLDRGYVIVGLEPVFTDPRTGRLLQVDAVFHRG